MKLIKFTAGTAGVPLWINWDAVSSVRADTERDSKLTLIATQDGKEHRVQEPLADVVNAVQS